MLLSDVLWPRNGSVALVGGGGKTSLMGRLVQEAGIASFPLILGLTTKLQRPLPFAVHNLQLGNEPPTAPADGRTTLWVGTKSENGKKWMAPELNKINSFIKTPPCRIVLEADGSAGRPIKASGINEPVILENISTVVAVLGIKGLGLPANDVSVHRLKPFLEITGLSEGEKIDTGALLRLVLHPQGSFKGCNNSMRRILLVNQADKPADLRLAEQLAKQVLKANTEEYRTQPMIEAIIITSFRQNYPIRCILRA